MIAVCLNIIQYAQSESISASTYAEIRNEISSAVSIKLTLAEPMYEFDSEIVINPGQSIEIESILEKSKTIFDMKSSNARFFRNEGTLVLRGISFENGKVRPTALTSKS